MASPHCQVIGGGVNVRRIGPPAGIPFRRRRKRNNAKSHSDREKGEKCRPSTQNKSIAKYGAWGMRPALRRALEQEWRERFDGTKSCRRGRGQ